MPKRQTSSHRPGRPGGERPRGLGLRAFFSSFDSAFKSRPFLGSLRPLGSPSAHRDVPTLHRLIADATHLARNNPMVRSMLSARQSLMLGETPRMECRSPSLDWNRRAEAAFEQWCADADVHGELDLWGLVEGVVAGWETDGDVLVVHVEDGAGYRVQVIEGARVCNPSGAADTPTMRGGVELDAAGVRPVRYHVCPWMASGYSLDFAAARAIDAGSAALLHNPRLYFPGQFRSEPGLASVAKRVDTLEAGADAALMAYRIAASIMLLIGRDDLAGGSLRQELDAGVAEDAGRGRRRRTDAESVWGGGLIWEHDVRDTVQQVQGEHPKAEFQSCYTEMAAMIAASLDLPREVAFFHTQRSYHAARSAIAAAWPRFAKAQRSLVARMLKPIYLRWLRREVLEGRLPAIEGMERCDFFLGQPPMLDPKAETETLMRRLAGGAMTHEQLLRTYGIFDREAFIRTREKEIVDERRIGLVAGQAPSQRVIGESVPEADSSAGLASEGEQP